MTKKLTPRSRVNHGPLLTVDLATASVHLGIPSRDLADLVDRLGIVRDGDMVEFGGRNLADLGSLYLKRLTPPTDDGTFRTLKRDWKLLQLPTDVINERVMSNVKSHLKNKGRPLDLVRLQRLLPFDADAMRETAKRMIREAHIERQEERFRRLPPVKQTAARRLQAIRDVDTDTRLDRHVAMRLECEPQHVEALYQLGLIQPDPDAPADGRRYALDPHLIERDEIRRRLSDEPPTLTSTNVRYYRIARPAFDLGAFDDHARSAIDDVLATFANQEICPSPGMVSRVMGGDPQQFVQPLFAHAHRTGKRIGWSRKWLSSTHQPTLRDLADVMNPDAPVPLTAIDWASGCPGQAPEASLIQKVFSLEDADDRTRAGIVALEGARMGIPFDTLSRAMIAVNVLLPLMSGLNPSIPHHVDSVLGPYAFLVGEDLYGQRRRLEHVLFYKTALQVSETWFNRLTPEQRLSAARFRLAWPSGAATLFKQVATSHNRVVAAAANDRDYRLAPWMDDPDRTMAFIMQKAERTFAFHDAVEACIAYADGQADAGAWDGSGPIHWLHDERFNDLSADGRPIAQRILFSIETWQSKCARLREAGRRFPDPYACLQRWFGQTQPKLVHNAHGGRPDPTLNENRYVVVVHGIVPLTPGDPVSPPRWYKLFKGCVFETGRHLSAELASERELAIKETGVHNLNLQMPSGLMNYAGTVKRTIARHVREAFGEVCVPVHELTHGVALAAFSASARYDLPERTSELAQTDLDEDKWESWTDPDTGEGYGIFQQVRKMSDTEEDFIFSPYTISVLTRLAAMASARLFSQGEWPDIEPDNELRKRSFRPSSYLVTDGRVTIPRGQMAALFYALVDGIGRLKPHDVKHLLNAIARREGVPLEVRRRWNLHALSSTTEGYGRPSRSEKEQDRLTFLRIQQGRRTAMMTAVGVRPTAEHQPYVTRREALHRDRALAAELAAVFRKHNRVEEMDEQLAKIRGIDEQIANLISGQAA